jgi:hypothetical protein
MIKNLLAAYFILASLPTIGIGDEIPTGGDCPKEMSLEKAKKTDLVATQPSVTNHDLNLIVNENALESLIEAAAQKIIDTEQGSDQPLENYLTSQYYGRHHKYRKLTGVTLAKPHVPFRGYLIDHPEAAVTLSHQIVDLLLTAPTFVPELEKFENLYWLDRNEYLVWRGVKNSFDQIRNNPAKTESVRQVVEENLIERQRRLTRDKTRDMKLRQDYQDPEIFMGDMFEIFSVRLPVLFNDYHNSQMRRILKTYNLTPKKAAALDPTTNRKLYRQLAEDIWKFLNETFTDEKIPNSALSSIYEVEVKTAQASAKDALMSYPEYLEAVHLLRQIREQPAFAAKFIFFLEASMPHYLKVLPKTTAGAWAKNNNRIMTRRTTGDGNEEANGQIAGILQIGFTLFGAMASTVTGELWPLATMASTVPVLVFGPTAVAMAKSKLFWWREKKAKAVFQKNLPGAKGQKALPPSPEAEIVRSESTSPAPQHTNLHLIPREEIAAMVPELDLADPGALLSYGGTLHTQVNALIGEFSVRVNSLLKDGSLDSIGAAVKEILPQLKNPAGYPRDRALQVLGSALEARLKVIIDYLTSSERLLKDFETASLKIGEFHSHAMGKVVEAKGLNQPDTHSGYLEPTLKGLESAKASATQMAALIEASKTQWTTEMGLIRDMLQTLVPRDFQSSAALGKNDTPLLQKISEYAAKKGRP